MDVVDASDTLTDQGSQEEKKQSSPICICVRFDANPIDTADNVFRGVRAFHSPSEVVVPLKGMLLEDITLDDLLTEFMSRAIRRFPRLSIRTVDSFYLNVEGLPMSIDRLSEQSPLIRLDVNMNGQDTLDNFFAPPLTTGPTVYDITAHWLSNIPGATNFSRNAAEESSLSRVLVEKKKKESDSAINVAEEEGNNETENGNENGKCDFAEETLPAPVVYPFTQRCTYAKLWPRTSESSGEVLASMELATLRAAALTATLTEREAARKERCKLESEEQASRRLLMGDEREARRTIAEIEGEGREQVIRLLRLMPDDVLPPGISPVSSPKCYRRYPMDTEPLFPPYSSSYKEELAQRVEETAWLSHVFASTPIVGSALVVAKESKKKNQKNDNRNNINNIGTGTASYASAGNAAAATRGGLDAVSSEVDGKNVNKSEMDDEVEDEYSAAMEDLIQHYADVRRDLLLWERQTFRALTTEMLLILEKQKRLDEEILRTAFHEELEKGGVLDFDNYAVHYEQQHALTQKEKTPDTKPNDTSQSNVTHQRETSPVLLESFGVYRGKEMKEEDFKTEAKSVDTEKTGITGEPTITIPPRPRPRSPRSCLADDEKFHQAIEESKARAKAILETIALIDMRWHEPVSFKLAKHRFILTEKDERKVILADEKKEWTELVKFAKERGLDLESRELLSYLRLIEPVVNGEQAERDILNEQQERHIALLFSLYYRGVERIQALLRQRE
ncbi:uncharacterized protein TM35_000015030 [Trypanosoma theileri]|uniref:Uncharacterized protein n=1 Tax=Trypanosoma theileri TaxID=67003 RepID=A0A1X0P9N5_9TRYP|nr:uncharacterized protein TM35_000015030 [Trypanosoma theileri]ORC93626.1 hypothetical protein TM35_000015030 [Trypanosoma theileri]